MHRCAICQCPPAPTLIVLDIRYPKTRYLAFHHGELSDDDNNSPVIPPDGDKATQTSPPTWLIVVLPWTALRSPSQSLHNRHRIADGMTMSVTMTAMTVVIPPPCPKAHIITKNQQQHLNGLLSCDVLSKQIGEREERERER